MGGLSLPRTMDDRVPNTTVNTECVLLYNISINGTFDFVLTTVADI